MAADRPLHARISCEVPLAAVAQPRCSPERRPEDGDRTWPRARFRCSRHARPISASTVPRTSVTPAESRWSPPCAALPATTSSPRASPLCATSTTAVPRARIPPSVTVPASSPRSRRLLPLRLHRGPPPGRRCLRRRYGVPAHRPGRARRGRGHRADRRRGRSRSVAGGMSRSPPTWSARWPGRACRTSPSPAVRSAIGRQVGAGLDRLAFRLRKRAEHETGVYFASLSCRTVVCKGMLTTAQLEPFFPTCPIRGSSVSRPGPLAVLDQHLPVLAAGPPVPPHRPQRRDQHGQGQPQLDAGRESMLTSDVIPGSLDKIFPICAPAVPTRPPSTRCSRAAPPRRAFAPARRADDDPRGVGEQPDDGPGAPGLLRVPLHLHGALGRSGLRDLHRRHPHRCGPGP